MLNVREAVRRIPEKVADLSASARSRGEEFGASLQRAQDGRREVAEVSARGRRHLAGALERLGTALREEEEATLAEVDRCSSDVSELLGVEDEAHIREAHAVLQGHMRAGDAVQTLNWYSRLKKALAAPAPAFPGGAGAADSSDPVAPLRAQLQRGFERRQAAIAEAARCLAELRPSAAAVRPSPAAGGAEPAPAALKASNAAWGESPRSKELEPSFGARPRPPRDRLQKTGDRLRPDPVPSQEGWPSAPSGTASAGPPVRRGRGVLEDGGAIGTPPGQCQFAGRGPDR